MAVVAGTAVQIRALDELIARDGPPAPVLVIGAGKVGQAAALALNQKRLVVSALDRDEKALATLARLTWTRSMPGTLRIGTRSNGLASDGPLWAMDQRQQFAEAFEKGLS